MPRCEQAYGGTIAKRRISSNTLWETYHHGSRTSSVEPFLDSVGPRVAVFPVGYRNRFGHPHRTVLARYEARGIPLPRTDRDGAIRFDVAPDGGGFMFERYRDAQRRYWMDR